MPTAPVYTLPRGWDEGDPGESAGIARGWRQMLRDSRGDVRETRGNEDEFHCNPAVTVPPVANTADKNLGCFFYKKMGF